MQRFIQPDKTYFVVNLLVLLKFLIISKVYFSAIHSQKALICSLMFGDDVGKKV